MAKTIAVLGSTGQQGGAVARACLKAGWNVRGISRNVKGGGAQALAAEGAEMVSADIDDLDSLVKAFEVGVFTPNAVQHRLLMLMIVYRVYKLRSV